MTTLDLDTVPKLPEAREAARLYLKDKTLDVRYHTFVLGYDRRVKHMSFAKYGKPTTHKTY